MPGSARSCSQIQSLNGSSFDLADARTYLGGSAAANARRIVLRCSPVRLLISRIDNRSTRCMRRISAHCSTPTNRLLLARSPDQTRVRTRPDEPGPAPGGSLFDRRTWVSIQAAPTPGAHRGRPLLLSPVQSLSGGRSGLDRKTANPAVMQSSRMARPGLEPGTPRFSVVRSELSNGAKSLQSRGCRAAAR